ncbi:hypothetical protein LR51B_14040 [Lacticaseibacillus rhamnosus 51B]|nr:hypothetical protein LR51B_14040 [Lacticaseibacillus rhamnosus 51B]
MSITRLSYPETRSARFFRNSFHSSLGLLRSNGCTSMFGAPDSTFELSSRSSTSVLPLRLRIADVLPTPGFP